MNIPNLYIVGAPKCGTTSLASYLASHPEVFFCTPKEPFFFADDVPHVRSQRSYNAIDEYMRLFPDEDCLGKKIIAEGSTNYLWSKTAIYNICKTTNDAKFIAILRNPVELVHAFHAEQLYARNEEVENFKEAWRLQADRKNGLNIPKKCRVPEFLQYSEFGMFSSQLERMFNLVPEENRLVILQDDMKDDMSKVYRKVLEFLNLDHDFREEFPIENQSHVQRIGFIADLVLSPPPMLKSTVRYMRSTLRGSDNVFIKGIKKFMYKEMPRKELSVEFREELFQFFEDDITKTEKLIGRDLARWRNSVS